MSTYLSPYNSQLSFDDIPFWLQTYLRYLKTIRGYTATTIITTYSSLRQYCKYVAFRAKYHHEPDPAGRILIAGDSVDEITVFQDMGVLHLSLDTVAKIQKKEIEQFHYFLSDVMNNASSTRNKKLSVIRQLYEYIVDEQEELREYYYEYETEQFRKLNCLHITLQASPAAKVIGSKVDATLPVYMPPEDIDILLQSISGKAAVRDYAIILLMLVTGVRLSELCAINLQDIGKEDIRVREGKGGKERILFLSEAARDALDAYLREYRQPLEEKLRDKNALFVSHRCRRLTGRAIEKMLDRRLLNAGLDNKLYSPHKLRHTAATTLVNDGADLLTVQRYLGHESPDTTVKYTHLADHKVRDAVKQSKLGSIGKEHGKEPVLPSVPGKEEAP